MHEPAPPASLDEVGSPNVVCSASPAAVPLTSLGPPQSGVGQRFRGCWGVLTHRPRRLLAVLGIVGLLLAASGPFLWCGYHWYAGRRALNRYHSGEALDHFRACLRIWPWSRSAEVHLQAARAARREGDFEEAVRLLQECQDRGGTSPESVLEWSLLHVAGGDLEKAEESLKEKARRDAALVPLVLEALIEGYLRKARVGEAIHCANEWLTREPNNVLALYLRGKISRQLGSSVKASADFRRVIELDPDHLKARRRLVVSLVDIGRYDEALQHLEYLQRRQPPDLELRVRRAVCLHRLGHSREARTLLDSVLAEHPDNGLALLTRGQIAQLLGQLPEAEKWLREAVRVMPQDYKTHWSLCQCLRQRGKTEDADEEQKRTDTLRDRWERLSELTTHLLSQNPDDPALQCELGKLLLQLGLNEAGRNWLLGALRLDEHYVPALTALADYYQQQGDTDAAKEYRERARSSAHP